MTKSFKYFIILNLFGLVVNNCSFSNKYDFNNKNQQQYVG